MLEKLRQKVYLAIGSKGIFLQIIVVNFYLDSL